MKHLNYILLGAAGLVLASCSQEDIVTGNGDGTANVSINLNVPQLATRSYSDGLTAVNLQYAVYKKNTATGELTWLDMNGKGTMTNLQDQVNLKLVTNHTYGLVFWADSGTTPYTLNFGANGATMSVKYDETAGTPTANDEKLDAFYAYHEIVVTGDATETVYLYRPFAQINVGTSDIADAAKAGYTPTVSHVKVSGIYDTLDLVSGKVSNSDNEDPKTHDYSFAAIPSGEKFPESVPNHQYLAMVYALVPAEQQTVEVEFCTKDASDLHAAEHKVGSVPVQRNYRTNIYGQLLTSNVDVNVIIEPAYEEPDYLVNHDGVEYDAASQTYTITNAHGLQWVAQRVNSYNDKSNTVAFDKAPNSYGPQNLAFKGQKIVLANDIDMTGVDFQAIGCISKSNGTPLNAFAGEFDGNNKTISNLTVKGERKQNIGLFGSAHYATIKNVNLTNVDIEGHYSAGAVVGYAWNTIIDNCSVDGGKIISTPWEIKKGVYDDGNNVGGIAGYFQAYPQEAAITNCKVNGLEIQAFRRVAGIVGGVGIHKDNIGDPKLTVTGNEVTNTTVTALMTETRYDDFEKKVPQAGAIYGLGEFPENLASATNVQKNESNGATVKVIKGAASQADLLSELQSGEKNLVLGSGEYVFTSPLYDAGNQRFSSDFTPATTLTGYNAVLVGKYSPNFHGATINGLIFHPDSEGNSIMGSFQGNFNNCEFTGNVYSENPSASFTNCSFTNLDTAKMAFHMALISNNVTVEGCTITGRCDFGNSGATVEFKNCKIDTKGSKWGFYGNGNYKFTNCEGISADDVKADSTVTPTFE